MILLWVRMMNKFDRLKAGFGAISPVQLLRAKLFGQVGAFSGLVFALVMVWFAGFSYFVPWLGFVAFLQVVDFVQSWKQYVQLVEIESLGGFDDGV